MSVFLRWIVVVIVVLFGLLMLMVVVLVVVFGVTDTDSERCEYGGHT